MFSSCLTVKPYTFVWIFGFLYVFAPSKMAMFQPWIIFVRTDGGRAEFVGNLLGAARRATYFSVTTTMNATLSYTFHLDMVPPFTQANIFDWQFDRHPAALY